MKAAKLHCYDNGVLYCYEMSHTVVKNDPDAEETHNTVDIKASDLTIKHQIRLDKVLVSKEMFQVFLRQRKYQKSD
jgi:hypothetical protein